MKVWLITVGEPLPTETAAERPWRTGLLSEELRRRGHEVVWWTSTVNHFNKTFHRTESVAVGCGTGLTMQFLHGRLYQRNISLQRLRNHREIAAEFRRIARGYERPDVVVCSFPTIELSCAAVDYGRSAGIPVLLDVRDLWPDEIAVRVPKLLRWLVPLALGDLYRQTELAFKGASGVIGISNHYLDWGLRHAGRARGPLDLVATHGYPDPLVNATHAPPAMNVNSHGRVSRKFWFAGTFVGSIDLGTVIEAARLLSHRPDIEFVLSGSGERAQEWQRQAQGLGNVVFTGWARKEQLASLAAEAYVGLAAYKRGALMSLTNKLFEYLGFGLPVLCSLPGEARALLESTGAGLFYEPENSHALAASIEALADSPHRRNEMSLVARRLFENQFSSDKVYSRLADHLESCVAR